MLQPKFKPDTSDRLYINEQFLSNGHWLFTRYAFKAPTLPKAAKALEHMSHGSYMNKDKVADTAPPMENIIPKRDGYQKLNPNPVGVNFRTDMDTITAFKYECLTEKSCDAFIIGVSTDYVSLMRMGHCFARDKISPIIILDEPNLNGNLLAIVMPMRLK